jgi:hypothetical protein
MSITQQLQRLESILHDLTKIDLGYPLGSNTISPPFAGAASSALSKAGLDTIKELSDLYSACDGIRMPDVHNGYFIYDLDRICSHYPDSDPCRLLSDNNDEFAVLAIGQDGGGNHFVLHRNEGYVLFLPIGPLYQGCYDGRHTKIRVVARDIPDFLDKLIDDATAFVNDEHGHRYLTDG